MIKTGNMNTLWRPGKSVSHLSPVRIAVSHYSKCEPGSFTVASFFQKDLGNGPDRKARNTIHPAVPIGDESCARLIGTVGEERSFNFKPKTVIELGEKLDILRTSNVGHTTGPRTYYFKGLLAQLEQALVQFAVRTLADKGFKLLSVPDLVHCGVIEGCGFSTSGERTQVYKLHGSNGQICLAGTGEIPIAGYLMNSKWSEEELPLRFMTASRCYRAETSDLDEEKGIYRVHQFTKVEMFGVTRNEEEASSSQTLMDEFLSLQKNMFQSLGLHFRILDMPTEELGAPAHRKYDIETLMPAKNMWGEISSTSNCTDFQSRRLNIQYQQKDNQTKYCHTVNGTAAAVPRLLMALLESHQNEDGTFSIPTALHPYIHSNIILDKPDHRSSNMQPIKWTKDYKKKVKTL